jgi:epsilon-lactone hydrolase
MKTQVAGNSVASRVWSVVHPITAEDAAAMATMRAIVEPNKGRLQGTSARVPFDDIMEHVAAPEGVSYETDIVGGVSGLWCKPANARSGEVVLHLHGGWFNWGSAQAYRHLVGHIAARAGILAFVPDYRLAPEHPFPAAHEDVRATYFGLIERGFSKIAVTGDSAGGNLALGLVAHVSAASTSARSALVGTVALSPVTDLSLSGESWRTRAVADPYFTLPQATELVRSYLAGHNATDPFVSPLHANLTDLPPIRVHVGDDEMLLDDSVRFVERAYAAGVDARLDVWEGMVHGFVGSIGRLAASDTALRLIGEFLAERFASASV